jgi:hypothetical protein
MQNFLETATIAIVLVGAALLLISIGWLITGKQKIKRGTCGRDPTKKSDDECGTKSHCQVCENNPVKSKKQSDTSNESDDE